MNSTRPVTASSRASTGPARAVRCACAIMAAVPELGLEVRAGLHAGECELIDGKMGGLAVHHRVAHRHSRTVGRSARFEHRQGSRSRVGDRVRGSRRARAKGCARHVEPLRGRPRLALIDQDDDAIADHLRFLEPQVASLALLVEDLPACPQDHGEDHQVYLIDEIALDQLLD